MPDLAATLQALAMSGPDSAASGSDGTPDLEATLRAAAAATAAGASGAASGPETDALFKECGPPVHLPAASVSPAADIDLAPAVGSMLGNTAATGWRSIWKVWGETPRTLRR